FGIFLALTEHTKVIRIPYQCSLTVQFASFSMLDLKSFFHAMQRDIGEEGANHPTLRRSRLRFVKDPFLHISCFQPLFDEFTAGNSSNGSQQVLVRNVIEGSFDIGIDDPSPACVRAS